MNPIRWYGYGVHIPPELLNKLLRKNHIMIPVSGEVAKNIPIEEFVFDKEGV